eukprot:gnl/MRDRNA2_/MRDRNA2_88286_c0_seq1.p1 gnl/MRDRNA2_/MRDRNA2_88286_c0~~gnl/MRDRNA2_/MRDRNA2_88286_c0_seq1.p1  ORF type:complete len:147 (+),score=39.92 gnl/MRDRNA2_/MRDRNA2_88286_c0_seq1:95-535(+)
MSVEKHLDTVESEKDALSISKIKEGMVENKVELAELEERTQRMQEKKAQMLARFEQTRDKMKDLNSKLDEQVSSLKADEDRCQSSSQRGCELGEPLVDEMPQQGGGGYAQSTGQRPESASKLGRKAPLQFRRHYPSRAEAEKSSSQ